MCCAIIRLLPPGACWVGGFRGAFGSVLGSNPQRRACWRSLIALLTSVGPMAGGWRRRADRGCGGGGGGGAATDGSAGPCRRVVAEVVVECEEVRFERRCTKSLFIVGSLLATEFILIKIVSCVALSNGNTTSHTTLRVHRSSGPPRSISSTYTPPPPTALTADWPTRGARLPQGSASPPPPP